jgi:enoyl-CoA hydratase/carnithine racemase
MEDILVRRQGKTAIITLNRPEKRNALSADMLERLVRALLEIEADPQVAGLVLTGSDTHFSPGADLHEALAVRTLDGHWAMMERWRTAASVLENLKKPTIAAINGFCLTGGLELALCCDLRIGGTNARLGITSSRIGTVAGGGATQRLPRLIGISNAKSMLFSAEPIDAQTALRMGLIEELTRVEETVPAAVRRIETFAQRAPLALWGAKLAVNKGMQMDLQAGLDFERQLSVGTFLSEDRAEGIAAFLEKREPRFKGK